MSKAKRRRQAHARAVFILGDLHPDVKRWQEAIWNRSLNAYLARARQEKADWAAELQERAA